MSEPSNICPNCGEAGTIEFGGKLWLDAVTMVKLDPAPEWAGPDDTVYELVNAEPAASADDWETGLVWTEDSYLRCVGCDTSFNHESRGDARAFFERYRLRPAK